MSIPLILGIIGAGVTLYAFILDQLGRVNAESFMFDLLNTIGSALLLVYAIDTTSWPFIITNVVWGLFSLWGVISYVLKKNNIKLVFQEPQE